MKLEFGKRGRLFIRHDYEVGDVVKLIWDYEDDYYITIPMPAPDASDEEWDAFDDDDGWRDGTIDAGTKGVVTKIDIDTIWVMFDGEDEAVEVDTNEGIIRRIQSKRKASINNPDLYDRPLFDLDNL